MSFGTSRHAWVTGCQPCPGSSFVNECEGCTLAGCQMRCDSCLEGNRTSGPPVSLTIPNGGCLVFHLGSQLICFSGTQGSCPLGALSDPTFCQTHNLLSRCIKNLYAHMHDTSIVYVCAHNCLMLACGQQAAPRFQSTLHYSKQSCKCAWCNGLSQSSRSCCLVPLCTAHMHMHEGQSHTQMFATAMRCSSTAARTSANCKLEDRRGYSWRPLHRTVVCNIGCHALDCQKAKQVSEGLPCFIHLLSCH